MTTISANLQAVRARLEAAIRQAGRQPGEVGLLAVSKAKPAAAVREAAACGQRAFGENYLQEALEKIEALADLDLEWHFIGPLQSNKTRRVAESFAWVHSVDRLKVAERLSEQRPEGLPPLNVCLQVNISGEETKSGVHPYRLSALAAEVARLPRLRLRGVMAIPEPLDEIDRQRAVCRRVRACYDGLCRAGYALDTLSLGMTHDLEAAVAEGATLVRIGTAIFGERNPL